MLACDKRNVQDKTLPQTSMGHSGYKISLRVFRYGTVICMYCKDQVILIIIVYIKSFLPPIVQAPKINMIGYGMSCDSENVR